VLAHGGFPQDSAVCDTSVVFTEQMLGKNGLKRYAENLTPLPMP
jgi:hypothetical protein